MIGGAYNVLRAIYDRLLLEGGKDFDMSFNVEELMVTSGLSRQAVINNIGRLHKQGLIDKIETRNPGEGFKRVRYKLKDGDTVEFIKNYLF